MASNTGKKILYILIGLLVLFLIAGSWLYFSLFRSPLVQIEGERTAWLYVHPDSEWSDVEHSITETMGQESRSPALFFLRAALKSTPPKVGAYRLSSQATPIEVYKAVAHGLQTPVKLTFTSRRVPAEIWSQLANGIMADSASIVQAMTDRALLREMGLQDSTMAYRLIPNTYEVYWTISPEDLVRRLEKEYEAFWSSERQAKAQRIGLTPSEVSILASIVEEESSKTDEYPLIAGLYLNRLRRGIPLQADPTVKYAVGDFALRRILLEHLQVDSPYNTYKVQGLPPGPIRIPSSSAIDGVLNARSHNYLYMVAKADFSGYHDFSETLAEHNRKARLYRQALNERGIK